MAGKLCLDKLIPAVQLMHPGVINNWLLGVESEEDKELLSEILQETKPGVFEMGPSKNYSLEK